MNKLAIATILAASLAFGQATAPVAPTKAPVAKVVTKKAPKVKSDTTTVVKQDKTKVITERKAAKKLAKKNAKVAKK